MTDATPDDFDDFYDLLKLDPTATLTEIEFAYRGAIRFWHPDNFVTRPRRYQIEAERVTSKLNSAIEVLREPERRVRYDDLRLEWLAFVRSQANIASFRVFLDNGLRTVFKKSLPISALAKKGGAVKLVLRTDFSLGDPDQVEWMCSFLGETYSASLRAKVDLILQESGEVKEQELYFVDVPLLTTHGKFVLYGQELGPNDLPGVTTGDAQESRLIGEILADEFAEGIAAMVPIARQRIQQSDADQMVPSALLDMRPLANRLADLFWGSRRRQAAFRGWHTRRSQT